ncbi:RNA polymerase sigma factor [Defluviimonas sp. WL0024]|uniref:RNA polymerase sigma factor n=1 Tax=Albidovulum salinarum TaxID=2984153 RepID=A0ABT2X8G5_9RHOB|nr:RNA polymerase sigma factor [Defluviimonas sp. WL0024]MCU9850243.1 RNA polymerase sigma factor [Defluviimonas sp. WL0024]
MSAPDPRDALPQHLPALRAFAISLSGDVASADDLVQDTIVKAWTNIDKFEPGTNMRAWLFTILRNTFFSDKRKRKREVPDPDGFHAGRLVEKPAHDGRLAFSDFKTAFNQLSPEHREVLILAGASGFSYEDVAEMTGVAVGTVKSRVNRARARLCELLGLNEGEDPISGPDGATLAVLGNSRVGAT